MGISYFEQERIFKLDGKEISYLIGIVDEEQFVGHIYFGKKIKDHRIAHLLRLQKRLLFQVRITGTDWPFMKVFHGNIPHVG